MKKCVHYDTFEVETKIHKLPIKQNYFFWYFTNYATCPWLSLLYPWLSLPYPWLFLAIPSLSVSIPALSLSIPVLSLAVPGIPCCPGVILGFTPVGQEDYFAALCSLIWTMIEAGAKLHIPGIKQGLVLINMPELT